MLLRGIFSRLFWIVLAAVAGICALAIFWLGAPRQDVVDLAIYLAGSGTLSISIGTLVAAWATRGKGRLQLRIAVVYGIGVVLSFLNIVLTAQLMFISEHDLGLLMLLLLYCTVISLALGNVLAGAVVSAVRRLTEAAQAVATGDLSVQVAVPGNDEVAELAREFNRMAAQLAEAAHARETSEQARRELVAAISHDLRTPLTALRAQVEALADGLVDDPATQQRYLMSMRGQIAHLSTLIDDLFELAQLEAGQLHLELDRASIQDLVSDTLEGLQIQARQKGIRLYATVAGGVDPVRMAPQKIERVLYNLVTNAIRHTPHDGAVVIEVEPAEYTVVVRVRDTGEGVSDQDMPYIFDKFYRGEKSRSRTTGGAGLGLAIARGIVEAHGGCIWVESRRGEGTLFSFTLPRG